MRAAPSAATLESMLEAALAAHPARRATRFLVHQALWSAEISRGAIRRWTPYLSSPRALGTQSAWAEPCCLTNRSAPSMSQSRLVRAPLRGHQLHRPPDGNLLWLGHPSACGVASVGTLAKVVIVGPLSGDVSSAFPLSGHLLRVSPVQPAHDQLQRCIMDVRTAAVSSSPGRNGMGTQSYTMAHMTQAVEVGYLLASQASLEAAC